MTQTKQAHGHAYRYDKQQDIIECTPLFANDEIDEQCWTELQEIPAEDKEDIELFAKELGSNNVQQTLSSVKFY